MLQSSGYLHYFVKSSKIEEEEKEEVRFVKILQNDLNSYNSVPLATSPSSIKSNIPDLWK